MGYKAVSLNTGLIKVREIQSYNKKEYVNINSNLSVSGNINVYGNTIIQSTLTSINFDDGALQVKGGASIKGNMNLLGNLNIGGIFNQTSKKMEDSVLVVKHPYVVPSGTDIGNTYFGRVGINTTEPFCTLDVNSKDAIKIPSGTRSERPINAQTGMIRYNTELSLFEGYGEAWGSLGGSSDIDADTDINVDQYYEDTPSGDNDDDIIRFTTRGIQNMIIDHTGKVGLGNVYHQSISEQEIRDGYIQFHFSSGFTNSLQPTKNEYNNALNSTGTPKGYNNVLSIDRRNGWAQSSLSGFTILADEYTNLKILKDINYVNKTGGDIDYGTFSNYLKKLPQSTLEIHGNVAISQNLNVGGYIKMPINKHIYLAEDENDYIVSKNDVDNNHLEIRCKEGDINLTAGGNIIIPSNVNLLFGNEDQSIRENGNNNLIINTSGNFTNTIGNDYIINSSGDNNIVSTSSSIELTSTNSVSEKSLKLNSNKGGINLKASNDKDININSGQVLIESQHNTSDSIKLETNSGNNESIKIINVEGENEPSIRINALKGGIEISANKSTSITGGKILLESKINQENAILLQTNNGNSNTNETILIENQKGNSLNAIQIKSNIGGINLNSKKDIYLNSEDKIQFNSNNSGFQFIGTSSDNITFNTSNVNGTFAVNDIIEGIVSGATVLIKSIINSTTFYVENLIGTFNPNENIISSPSNATGTFTSINYTQNQVVIDITNTGKTIFKDVTDSSRTDNELNTYINEGWSLRKDIDFASEFSNTQVINSEGSITDTSGNGSPSAQFTVTRNASNHITSIIINQSQNPGAGYKIDEQITLDNVTFTLKRHHLNILAKDKIRPDPSVKIEGGALVGKDLWVEQNINVLQNLNVFGNNIQVQAEQLVIDDPLIIVGINQNTLDTSDYSYAGIMNRYKDTNNFKFAGLVRTPAYGTFATWEEQIDNSNWGGEWHLLNNIDDNSDNQNPNITTADLEDNTKHSDLHISNLKILGTTNSTAFNRGSLVLTNGGIGVNKQVNIGSTLLANVAGTAGDANNAALVVKGGISVGKNIFMNKQNGTTVTNSKIQWSATQFINVVTDNGIDTMNINSDTGKIALIASTGGGHNTLGNIQFRHNTNDSFSFDDSGRIKVDGNLVMDVNGDIILDVPSSSKHISYRVNEQKFFSIYDDGSYNAILKNTYSSNDKHIIIKSSKDVELIRFTDTLVKLNNNIKLQLGNDTSSYIQPTLTNLLFNVNNDLLFSTTSSNTEIARINKTDSTLQLNDNTKLTFKDINQYISGTTDNLTFGSGNDIVFKLSNIEIFRTDKTNNSLIINSTKKLVFENKNNYIYGDSTNLYLGSDTVNFNSNIRIPSQSKLYIGSDNQYITSDGSNINFEFTKTNVKIKAGNNNDDSKKLQLESDGNIELTGGVSSNGIVKILNTTTADITKGALKVDGGITIAENVVSTGFKTYGPLELRDKVFYVPQIQYYNPGSESNLYQLSNNNVLSIISVEQIMSDHFYLELKDGLYNGQIKKIVLHPRYEAHRTVQGYHVNIDIDHFCDPDGGALTNATLILNRGGQTLNLIWVGLDAYSSQVNNPQQVGDHTTNPAFIDMSSNNITSYWLLMDNSFDYL